MNFVTELPEGYREIFRVNLAEDKKMALRLNGAALLIAALMAVPVAHFVPISPLFDLSSGFLPYLLRFLVLLGGTLLYIVLHELTHGVTMKLFGAPGVKYGFKGVFAYAGCEDYFGKGAYITVALAPLVLFLFVLAAINFLVPTSWFWVVYFIQIQNVSGAVGDLYVTARFLKMPKDILIKDTGVSMTVYHKS